MLNTKLGKITSQILNVCKDLIMEHEWIYEYDSLTINSKKFYFRCVWAYDKKTPQDNKPSIGLVFNIILKEQRKLY